MDNYDEPFTLCEEASEKPPTTGDEWYAICGLPYENPMVINHSHIDSGRDIYYTPPILIILHHEQSV